MDCREARDFYSDYVENAPGTKDAGAHEHITACPTCMEETRRLGALLGVLKKLPDEALSPNFIVGVNEKIDALENKGFLDGVWAIFTGRGGFSRALATAATLVLVILGAVYFGTQSPLKTYDPTENALIASEDTGKIVAVQPAPVYNAPSVVRFMRSVGGTSPVQPVSFGSAPPVGYAPAPSENVVDESAGMDSEDLPTATLSQAKTGERVTVPNHVIIIRSEDPTDTTAQLHGLVQSSYGRFLVYSPEITFVGVPAEIADRFLIALDSLGKTTVINAPVEKPDAAYYLYEIIVLPSNP